MAVSFTPNIGLAKPTESELAEDWVNGPQLASDNNAIIAAKTNITLTAYTPTFIGPTTNPSAGVGAVLGEYQDIQGFIFGGFSIQFLDPGVGSGTGTGGYGIKLPTLVDTSYHVTGTALNQAPGAFACIGEAYLFDASGSAASSFSNALDIIRIAGVDYARPITETRAAKTVEWLGPGVPFAFQTGDYLFGSFVYKKA